MSRNGFVLVIVVFQEFKHRAAPGVVAATCTQVIIVATIIIIIIIIYHRRAGYLQLHTGKTAGF
jgi:hypothetical protein